MQRLYFTMLLCFAVQASELQAAKINVFAAASLTDSLKEIADRYEKQSGDDIVFNFAASSFLARQIEEGAPADIFFSADEAKMDRLASLGLIVKETRRSPLSNILVIVAAVDSAVEINSPNDLAGEKVKRIALADPKTVPAGIYAKKYLETIQLWPALARKVVPTDNVRAALAAVESGNVEAGIVYKTDALISRKTKIAYEVPVEAVPVISYPMAVIQESKQRAAAMRFLAYLDSEDALRVFEKFGFILADD